MTDSGLGNRLSETDIDDAELFEEDESRFLNGMIGITFAVSVTFLIIASSVGQIQAPEFAEAKASKPLSPGDSVELTLGEPIYMPRHEECIDMSNGQDEDYAGYGVGYEPSLSIDSKGNMQITAHKDLRWGGEGTPFGPILGGPTDSWYACEDGAMTSWDYWASWFWVSTDNGTTWDHADQFEPTPGNLLNSAVGSVTGGASECLGDEGDIAVDNEDVVYYLDTTLEDNWWHRFTEGGDSYEMGNVCQRMNTMAADDRPWVAAQGDGIIHYLGNSGATPPECTGDNGRYWYYHSEDGGNTFSQCFAMPGGWSTISSENNVLTFMWLRKMQTPIQALYKLESVMITVVELDRDHLMAHGILLRSQDLEMETVQKDILSSTITKQAQQSLFGQIALTEIQEHGTC